MKFLTALLCVMVAATMLAVTVTQIGVMIAASAVTNPADPTQTDTSGSDLNWTGTAHPTSGVPKSQTTVVYGIRVHVSFAAQFEALMVDARANGINMGGWGWRSPDDQIRLRKQNCGSSYYAIYQMPSGLCSPPTARPGGSRHERGTAVDLTCEGRRFAGTKCADWIFANVRLDPVTCNLSPVGTRYTHRANCYGIFNFWKEPWHFSVDGR